jgi:MFS transporter, MHS family, proline/betaine transporter
MNLNIEDTVLAKEEIGERRNNIGLMIIGSAIGNLTEWYNFLLYGYLAPILSQLFFPTQDKWLSIFLVFVIFALGFLVRPIGGILFGWIGDTYGRQRALIISIAMMSIPTLLIGCLPTYATLGVVSPILFCVFRILQGLSAGGELTGAAIYLAEQTSPKHRAFWISFIPASSAVGILASSAISLLMTSSLDTEQLSTFGWRLAYWLGAMLGMVSFWLRIQLPEIPYFQKKVKRKYPLFNFVRISEMRKDLLIIFSLASSWGIFYQIIFIWMPTYLTQFQHINQNIALQLNSFYLLIFIFLMLCVSYYVGYANRKLLLILSCLGIALAAYPSFKMLTSGELWQIYLAMGIFTLFFSIYLPAAFIMMVEMFHIQIRYTALSLGFNMGLAIFGGTCPLIVTWLIKMSDNPIAPAFYMTLAALSALLTGMSLKDKKIGLFKRRLALNLKKTMGN